MNTRRAFLKSSAGLAAVAAARPFLSGAPAPATASLPTVRFGQHEVSRLLVGCNQFYGYSHFNQLLDQLMRDWNTPERVCETLRQCERNGINAFQYGHNDRALSDLQQYRASGGKMLLIATETTTDPVEESVKRIQPIALYHHGERTDVLFRAGKMDQVQEYTKKLRQTGVLVGIGTHKPEVVEYAEERGWDVDFYTLCAYNRTRTPEELRKLLGVVPEPPSEVYLETDPPVAYRVARQTPKTCFLFKILAAGRRTRSPQSIDDAFATALANIKPNDCIVVGMYPRYKDEVKENCDRVRQILSSSLPASLQEAA
jgi:hypothetical protein